MHLPTPRIRLTGFSLLELLFAVVILGILLAIGVPSFTSMIRSNSLTKEVNNLSTALNLARSEAVKRGARVTVCGSTNGTSCATSAWNSGWIVFSDAFGTVGAVDGTSPNLDSVIQRYTAAGSGFTYAASADFVTFLPTGAVAANVSVKRNDCTNNDRRQLNVQGTGRISVTKVTC